MSNNTSAWQAIYHLHAADDQEPSTGRFGGTDNVNVNENTHPLRSGGP